LLSASATSGLAEVGARDAGAVSVREQPGGAVQHDREVAAQAPAPLAQEVGGGGRVPFGHVGHERRVAPTSLAIQLELASTQPVELDAGHLRRLERIAHGL
jgi:hypothetical protein